MLHQGAKAREQTIRPPIPAMKLTNLHEYNNVMSTLKKNSASLDAQTRAKEMLHDNLKEDKPTIKRLHNGDVVKY